MYQAPEQMIPNSIYGKPVDVFAVGLIMYELIAGRHPIYTRGEDRIQYTEKLKNYKELKFNSKFSK